jgi:hypothetical protein
MSLSSTPQAIYIWDSTESYTTNETAWYNGIWYKYIFTTASTAGELPTEATATFTATNTLPTKDIISGESYATETRVMRSWTIVDPRTLAEDPDGPDQPPFGITSKTADLTAAALRGLNFMALEPPVPEDPFGPNPFIASYPAFGSVELFFTEKITMPKVFVESGIDTTRTVRNFESSWAFYGSLAGMSVDYGKAVEGFDAVNSEMTLANLGGMIFGNTEYFKDNDGYFDERVARINAGSIPDEVGSDITTTRTVDTYSLQAILNVNQFDFGNTTQVSIRAVSVSAWFGQTVEFRAYKIYTTYSKVDVPGAFIGDPDIEKYLRDGGSLVLVSGDGVLTPRVYDWVGPFMPAEIEFTAYANYELSAQDVAMPVVTGSITIGPGKLCLESGIVMKDVTPGHDS